MVDGREINVIGNNFVDFRTYMEESEPDLYKQFDEKRWMCASACTCPPCSRVIERVRADGVDFNQALNDNMAQLVPKHILVDDISGSR